MYKIFITAHQNSTPYKTSHNATRYPIPYIKYPTIQNEYPTSHAGYLHQDTKHPSLQTICHISHFPKQTSYMPHKVFHPTYNTSKTFRKISKQRSNVYILYTLQSQYTTSHPLDQKTNRIYDLSICYIGPKVRYILLVIFSISYTFQYI